MAITSNIEWCDATWNPTRGCSRVSAGCQHCYAERQAVRHKGPGGHYEGLLHPSGAWNGTVRLVPEALDLPLRWRKPKRIFVDSMSDLFHESVPDEFIARVFAVMMRTLRHRYIILTKRPARMAAWIVGAEARVRAVLSGMETAGPRGSGVWSPWPLPNVWLGVSCEDQPTADERIPLLLQTPAAVRLVSLEPLLGPVNLRRYLDDSDGRYCTMGGRARRAGDRFRGEDLESRSPSRRAMGDTDHSVRTPPRGEPDRERLPADSGDEGRRAGQRAGTSSGLCEPAWPNPGRADGEPHQRREARQPASEYGTRNSVRAGHPRARGAGEDESERCEEQCGEADSGTGGGDTVETPERRSIEGNRHGLRNQRPDGVEDCAPASLAWVICGGESGPGARPFDVGWVRSVVTQGREAGVPTFVKQLGAQPVIDGKNAAGFSWLQVRDGAWLDDARVAIALRDRKGGDPSEWPEDLRVREWPQEPQP